MCKILFVCNNLEVGGVQKSLLNLLKNISNDYDVSLLLFNDESNYMKYIPHNVELIKTNKYLSLLGNSQNKIKNKSYFLFILRGLLVLYSRIFNNVLPRKFIFSKFKCVQGFDIVISFTQDIGDKNFAVGCNDFVLRKTICNNKISFVHCDFKNYGGNTTHNRSVYENFDKIVCVSNGCRENFVSENPSLKQKTLVVRNFHDFSEILNKAKKEQIIYDPVFFNIVTVARLSKEKGIIRALYAVKNVISKGMLVKWHIVGDGEQHQQIENAIRKLGLSDFVILYGNDNNPYKYIINADVFMLPSFHEAAPLVYSEAQALGVPVVTTDTVSAREFVEKTNSGYVCGNTERELEDCLIYIISNKRDLLGKRILMKECKQDNKIANKQFKSLIRECMGNIKG